MRLRRPTVRDASRLLVALAASSCVSSNAPAAQGSRHSIDLDWVRKAAIERAFVEFSCPREKIELETIRDWGNENVTFRVSACGHRATYTCLSLEYDEVCVREGGGEGASP